MIFSSFLRQMAGKGGGEEAARRIKHFSRSNFFSNFTWPTDARFPVHLRVKIGKRDSEIILPPPVTVFFVKFT